MCYGDILTIRQRYPPHTILTQADHSSVLTIIPWPIQLMRSLPRTSSPPPWLAMPVVVLQPSETGEHVVRTEHWMGRVKSIRVAVNQGVKHSINVVERRVLV